jgi:hypothetical protein
MGGTAGQPVQAGQGAPTMGSSRAALAVNQPSGAGFSDWLASVPDWAGTSEGQAFLGSLNRPSSIATPTTAAAPVASGVGAGDTAAGFQSAGLLGTDLSALPHIGGQAPEPEPEPTPAPAPAVTPANELGTKIWPPGPQWDTQDVKSWLAANPHWSTAVEVPDRGPIGTPGNSWYQPKGAPL